MTVWLFEFILKTNLPVETKEPLLTSINDGSIWLTIAFVIMAAFFLWLAIYFGTIAKKYDRPMPVEQE